MIRFLLGAAICLSTIPVWSQDLLTNRQQVVVNINAAPYTAACNGIVDDAPTWNQFIADYTPTWWVPTGTYSSGQTVVSGDGSRYTSIINGNTTNPAFGLNSGNWTNIGAPPTTVLVYSGTCLFAGSGDGFHVCPEVVTDAAHWPASVPNLIFSGYGASITAGPFQPGCEGIQLAGYGLSFFATTGRGSKCVPLSVHMNALYFVPGQWAAAMGVNNQGRSYPPNPDVWEYVQIYSADTSTGLVCFTNALRHDYKDTWPLYTFSFNINFGPATLIPMETGWNMAVEWHGGTINASDLAPVQRSIVFKDQTWVQTTPRPANMMGPSSSLYVEINNVQSTGQNLIDKMVDTIVIKNGSVLTDFSGTATSNVNVLCDHSSIGNFTFDQKNFKGSHCTFLNNISTATFTGFAKTWSCDFCVVLGITFSVQPFDYIAIGATMAGGVITVPNSYINVFGPVRLTPGGNYCFAVNGGLGERLCVTQAFQVLDYTSDGTNTYFQTSLSGGFPLLPADPLIIPYYMPEFTCSNCTGSEQALDWSRQLPGLPLFSESIRTYTCSTIAAPPPIYLFGKLVQATYNVIVADSTQATLKANAESVTVTNGATQTSYIPVVNLKTTGARVVTPSGTSGTVVGDSITSPGTKVFSGPDQVSISTGSNPSGDSPCLSLTNTIQTDPGVVATTQ